MAPLEAKTEFIRMRAEGKSYRKIAEALHISRSTCGEWEQEFKEDIARMKQDQLNDLYEAYYMTKQARIEKLGHALQRINTALDGADLTAMEPKELLDYQLKYMAALREEYTGTGEPFRFPAKVELPDIINALGDLMNRTRAGDITTEQARNEGALLANLMKAYDISELQTKLDALEAVLGGRK